MGLVISMASNAPAMAGIHSAIVGGLFATFIRGSNLGINGPGNTLIPIVAGGVMMFGGGLEGYKICLAAFFFAGLIQVVFAVLKLGRFADVIPNSVIYGLLAAIGVIIMAKQLHFLIGVEPMSGKGPEYEITGFRTLDFLLELPHGIGKINIPAAVIGLSSLVLLFLHPRFNNKLIHFIPAPVWVLLVSIPLAFCFDLFHKHEFQFLDYHQMIKPSELLVHVPDNYFQSFLWPDFSMLYQGKFWLFTITIVLIGTVETLSSAKAVDKLDPFRRKTNMNKDLLAMGFSTSLVSLVGGLPIVTAVARSSVNANLGAKTKLSNFLHGAILLCFVLFLTPLLNRIPEACLAAILVYTGFKLTAPNVFFETRLKGREQLLIMIITYLSTLLLGLITGLLIGIGVTLIVQWYYSELPFKLFLKSSFKLRVNEIREKNHFFIKVRGVNNEMNILQLSKKLSTLKPGSEITIDFSNATLVGHTVLDYMNDFVQQEQDKFKAVEMVGLGLHQTTSTHPLSLHFINRHRKQKDHKRKKLSKRQILLKELAENYGWEFMPEFSWQLEYYNDFQFFRTRSIEFKHNVVLGRYNDLKTSWEVADITFDEGAMVYHERYHTTVQIIKLPIELPEFQVEREEFFDKVLQYAKYEDIDMKYYTGYSKKFLVKAKDNAMLDKFFDQDMIDFFNEENIYHLECAGDSLAVFKYVRLATPKEVESMIEYGHRLVQKLYEKNSNIKVVP